MLKNDHISKARDKTSLKSFAYNYLDLGVRQFISDNKKYQNVTRTER